MARGLPAALLAAAAVVLACSDAGASAVRAVRQCGLPEATFAAGPASFNAVWGRSSLGLTGGDSALSTRLPDGRVLWLFGDSFIGGMRGDGTREFDAPLVRNALVVEDRDCLTTLYRGDPAAPREYLPAGNHPNNSWYWPNQPFVSAGRVLLFLTHLKRTGPGGWDFAPTGSALASLRLPGLGLDEIQRVPTAPQTYFGVAVTRAATVTYVFGVDERHSPAKGLLVARVAGDLAAGRWKYWDGRHWVARVARARPILRLPACQFSVLRTRNRQLLLITQDGLRSRVLSFRARTPVGPWSPGPDVATVPQVPGAMVYNAVPHVEFRERDHVLLSYSVNARAGTRDPLTLDPVQLHPELYRPRFTTARIPLAG